MFGRLNGVVFVVLLFITSFLGAIFILMPFVPLALLAPKSWRACADRFVGYWLTFPASLLSFVFGVRFHVTGDLVNRDKPAIILMNHRTRLDWLFLWNALYRMDPWLLTTEKISLKRDLKMIPGAGWAMGCGAYIFLARSFERDRARIEKLISYYKDAGRPYQLLLFAEGTDRGPHAIEASDKFAEQNNLPKYEQVVHPRVTGFNFLLEYMRNCDYLENVYDVTVAYGDHIVQSEADLFFQGRFPKNIHFDFKAYSESEVPRNEEESATWLREKWLDKEMRLREFYAQEGEKKLEPSGARYQWPVDMVGFGYYVAFSFWILSSIMWLGFFWVYPMVRLYVLLSTAFYVYAHIYHDGIEFLVIKWFYASAEARKGEKAKGA